MHGHRALGDLNEIDALDGSPPDQSECLDEDAILIGADGGPAGLQQGNVVVGEGGRRHGERQPIRGAGDPGGREKHRSQRGSNIHGKVGVIAPVGDRVATNTSFFQVCAHVNLMPSLPGTHKPFDFKRARTFTRYKSDFGIFFFGATDLDGPRYSIAWLNQLPEKLIPQLNVMVRTSESGTQRTSRPP